MHPTYPSPSPLPNRCPTFEYIPFHVKIFGRFHSSMPSSVAPYSPPWFVQFQRITPGKIVVLGGASAIVLGTILLLLPWATPPSKPLSIIDALFTATSAVCATGLIVADTPTDFTMFGQTVVLVLIQIGGLGYATLVTLLLLTMRRQIGLRNRLMMAEALSTLNLQGLIPFVKAIVMWTVILELVGALLLSFRFLQDFPLGQAIYHGTFQAIAAFNNAGFSSFSTNLITYRTDLMVNFIVPILIIFGGLGFFVLVDMSQFFRGNGIAFRPTPNLCWS